MVMQHVLEHCYNPLQVFTNLYDLINTNGYLICEVPNNNCLALSFAGAAWAWLDIPRHLSFFTQKSLKTFSEKVGFNITATYYNGYTRQFTNRYINEEALIYDTLVSRVC
jgi:predicted SAM-dependent methyltransferase